MKRKLLVIGIGAGNPDYVTIQAVKALNRVAVFFIPNKGADREELARVRREICERHISNTSYRLVDFDVPAREISSGRYEDSVAAWRRAVEAVYERLIAEELAEDECGGFLVWGDPSLYDGTLRILDSIRSRGRFELDYEVIPGISSIQALAARHKVALNRIGQSVMITTGRQLADGFPDNADNVVVMLDAQFAIKAATDDIDIFWGAYLGTQDEILVAGKLHEVAGEIERLRRSERERKGWIMDTYLLAKPGAARDE